MRLQIAGSIVRIGLRAFFPLFYFIILFYYFFFPHLLPYDSHYNTPFQRSFFSRRVFIYYLLFILIFCRFSSWAYGNIPSGGNAGFTDGCYSYYGLASGGGHGESVKGRSVGRWRGLADGLRWMW